MPITRYLVGLLAAVIVTFALFYIMQSLVVNKQVRLEDPSRIRLLDPLARQAEREVEIERREARKPPEPETPPEIDLSNQSNVDPNALSVAVDLGNVGLEADISVGTVGAPSDGEYLPIVKVQPPYPRRAQERGIEGECLVAYTVTGQGTTTDIRVVEGQCTPRGYFERASVQAAEKFKYKPKVVNGQPIAVANVQNLFSFNLADDNGRGRRR